MVGTCSLRFSRNLDNYASRAVTIKDLRVPGMPAKIVKKYVLQLPTCLLPYVVN